MSTFARPSILPRITTASHGRLEIKYLRGAEFGKNEYRAQENLRWVVLHEEQFENSRAGR